MAAEATVQSQPEQTPRRLRFSVLVGRMSAVELFVAGLALITAPLSARALGPMGRGDLAAILVTLSLVPMIAFVGLGPFAKREAARGTPVGAVIGSVGAILMVTGLIGAALAIPIADFLSDGKATVRLFIAAGLLMLPLSLFGGLLLSVTAGRELWGRTIAARLIPPVGGVIGIVTLYLLGELTLATAASITLITSVLQIVPGLFVLRRAGKLRVERSLLRAARGFGLRSWATTMTAQANVRLDQLVMIKLVPSRELGFYAVAATISTAAAGIITSAVHSPLAVRTAKGESVLVARALRVTLFAVAVTGGALAATVPFLVPFVFGESFTPAAAMAEILLVGSVFMTGMNVLSTAMAGAGQPGAGAKAQLAALAITVPGLAIALPTLGGIGAAIVSVLAYGAAFAFVLTLSIGHFGGTFREFVFIRRSDLAWAARQVTEKWLSWRQGRDG
jgi:O-antigen/teichoic acid export membrane protein